MSLEKDIAMMVMLKKVKEINMVNVVQNQDSFYQKLNTELERWQDKLQQHIGMNYVPNFTSTIPALDYVYAYLDKNQELVISSVDLHPDDSDLYDKESNFGKCKLKNDYYQTWYQYKNDILIIRFEGIVKPITCAYLFSGCYNLTEIKNIENLYTNECTNMYAIFYNCKSLSTLDLSNFDTSKVTNMSYMFSNCKSLTTLDLRNFDTSKVTDMPYMFFNCKSLTNLNISNFDTMNVTDMSCMFYRCESLSTLNVGNFDTSKVTDMSCMFYNCKSLTSLNLRDKFDTSNITSMYNMFDHCTSLTSITCPKSTKNKIISMRNTNIPSTITWNII